MRLYSQVIISSQMDKTIAQLEALRTDERIIKIIKEERFLVEDTKLAIEKAYMASKVSTVIILGAQEFPPIIQNRLLKVIEEPPTGVEFILITPSKATILPTIRSRMPITILKESKEKEECELDMRQLDLASVYDFIQKNKRMDITQAKTVVEQISLGAINSDCFKLDEKTLQLFANAYKALDVGSSTQFVLTALLLKLLAKRKV